MSVEFIHAQRQRRFDFFGVLYDQKIRGQRLIKWNCEETTPFGDHQERRAYLNYFIEKKMIESSSGSNAQLSQRGISEFEMRLEALHRLEKEIESKKFIWDEQDKITKGFSGDMLKAADKMRAKEVAEFSNRKMDIINFDKPLFGTPSVSNKNLHQETHFHGQAIGTTLGGEVGSQTFNVTNNQGSSVLEVIAAMRQAVDAVRAQLPPEDLAKIQKDINRAEESYTEDPEDTSVPVAFLNRVSKFMQSAPAFIAVAEKTQDIAAQLGTLMN